MQCKELGRLGQGEVQEVRSAGLLAKVVTKSNAVAVRTLALYLSINSDFDFDFDCVSCMQSS